MDQFPFATGDFTVAGCFLDKCWYKCLLRYLKSGVELWCVMNWSFSETSASWQSWKKNTPVTKEKMLNIFLPKNTQHFPSIHCHLFQSDCISRIQVGNRINHLSYITYALTILALSNKTASVGQRPKMKTDVRQTKVHQVGACCSWKFSRLLISRDKKLSHTVQGFKIIFPIMNMNYGQDWRCWKVNCSEYLVKCAVTACL